MTTTIIAACQASDALKVLLGRMDLLSGTLLSMDLWNNQRRRIELRSGRDPGCVCCGRRMFEYLDREVDGAARVLCGRNSVQVGGQAGAAGIDGAGGTGSAERLAALAERLRRAGLEGVEHAGTSVRARTRHAGAPLSLTVFADGRTIVGGTTDASVARSVHAKYVGA